LSELVAARKTSIPAYAAVVILGSAVGVAGVLLSTNQFIALLAGLLLMAIALAKTEFAIALLVAVAPLTNLKVDLGPIPLDAVTICTAIVIFSYAINNLGKNENRISPPFSWAFIAFLVFGAVSAVVAPSIVDSVSVLTRFIGYFLLVYIIGNSIKSKEMLTRILVLMVVIGALTALFGIYQYLYEPQTAKIGLYDLDQEVAARVGSTFENPNFYAEYLVLLIPIGLALVLGSRGLFRRFMMGGATLLMFAGLILTYTRGSWLATGIGVILMSLLTKAWLFWVWVGLFAVAFVAAPGVASRLESISNVTGGTAGFRMKLWRIASGIIQEHPLLGIGIGNYYNVFTEYIFRHPELSVGWVIYGAHNSYLTIWAETGIFGIISFIAIILISIKYGLYLAQAKAKDKYLSWINSAIFAGVVGFSINSLTSNSFHHPQGAVFFWIMLGLQVAINGLEPEPSKTETTPAVAGSLILRPFRVSLIALKAAYLSHPVHKFFAGLGGAWRKSDIANWLYKKPAAPAFFRESRSFKPVLGFFKTSRVWFENSWLFSMLRDVGARPFITAALFITATALVRFLTTTVVR